MDEGLLSFSVYFLPPEVVFEDNLKKFDRDFLQQEV